MSESLLDEQELDYLTRLSHIACTDEEKQDLMRDLQKILGHFELLSQYDTEHVEPSYTVFSSLSCPLRKDEVGDVVPREDFLKISPSHVAGMIKIPAMFGEDV